MDSVDSVDPVPGQSRHARRRVLGAGTFGLVTLGLPSASSAASVAGESSPVVQPSAPTGVSGTPIGYISGSTTGAIRVSWSAVTGATSYQVGYATSASGPFSSTLNTAGTETTLDITGLSGAATTYHFVVRTNSGGTLSADSSTASSTNVIATGGTVTSFVGNGTIGVDGTRYVVHSFTSTGSSTFSLNRDMTVEHLIVAGGGSGGSRHGGGGGAGGLLTNVGTGASRTAASSPYTVVVGAGGAGSAQHNQVDRFSNPNYGGEDSSVFSLTAVGGGRGGGAANGAGGSGGSGGGSAQAEQSGGAGTTSQGNNGGTGYSSSAWAGGGGGGAGSAGSNGTANAGANGGAGVANTITGSSVTYAGGGGGSSTSSSGSGGSGGGGAGSTSGAGTSGTSNRGAGGGAGGFDGANINYAGGNGGSGIVVLRYAVPA